MDSDTCLVLLRASGVVIASGTSQLDGLTFDDAVRIDSTPDAVINLRVREVGLAYLVRLTIRRP